jgi:hypothetical protein
MERRRSYDSTLVQARFERIFGPLLSLNRLRPLTSNQFLSQMKSELRTRRRDKYPLNCMVSDCGSPDGERARWPSECSKDRELQAQVIHLIGI